MNLSDALLDSWDRQCRIVDAVAGRIDEHNRGLRPSEEGWPIDHHLAHVHNVRRFFLSNVAPGRGAELGDAFIDGWETPIQDLDQIKALLGQSGPAVGEALREAFASGVGQVGWYDHPVLFLHHLMWHEGWHVGLVFLALRRGGQEPPEEWEEENVWGLWRTEEW
jgi:uncharacterized damage-inducible protein DinB